MWIKLLADWLGEVLAPYEPIFKVISYFVGPAFAAVAFVWNRRDRRELIEQAQALGVFKEEVRAARIALDESQKKIQRAYEEVARKGAEVEKLESDLRSITEGSQELWRLRPAKAFPEYLTWMRDPEGARLITIGNLKGGVGKTTLAANFAAYLSHKRNRPVLGSGYLTKHAGGLFYAQA
jgi:hypothetical protein